MAASFADHGDRWTLANADGTATVWKQVTAQADPWLDGLSTADMLEELPRPPGFRRPIGDAIRRMTYHYWFHIGEILAIRQLLGHRRLPEYVGDIETKAPYRPEG